jgi:hypothetical protein
MILPKDALSGSHLFHEFAELPIANLVRNVLPKCGEDNASLTELFLADDLSPTILLNMVLACDVHMCSPLSGEGCIPAILDGSDVRDAAQEKG